VPRPCYRAMSHGLMMRRLAIFNPGARDARCTGRVISGPGTGDGSAACTWTGLTERRGMKDLDLHQEHARSRARAFAPGQGGRVGSRPPDPALAGQRVHDAGLRTGTLAQLSAWPSVRFMTQAKGRFGTGNGPRSSGLGSAAPNQASRPKKVLSARWLTSLCITCGQGWDGPMRARQTASARILSRCSRLLLTGREVAVRRPVWPLSCADENA